MIEKLDITYPWTRSGKPIWRWLWDFRPICFCNHEKLLLTEMMKRSKIYIDSIKTLNYEHEQKLEERTKDVAKIVDRATKISFTTDNHFREYAIQIRFCPDQFGMGFWTTQQTKLLAQYVGRQVEAEIASLRFIQEARVEYYNNEDYYPKIPATFDPTIKPPKTVKPKKKK